MSNIHPDINTIMNQKVPPTTGELYLLNFLKNNLPNNIEIYFQPFINGDKPDIILIQKNAGITIIEVKDWDLHHYYIDENIAWRLKKNDAKIKSPFSQVQTYKDNMFALHLYGMAEKKILNSATYGIVKTIVYFHCETKNSINSFLGPKKQNNTIALAKDELSKLQFMLPRQYSEARSLFTEDVYQETIRLCKPPYHVLEEGIEIQYTPRQIELSVSKTEQKKIRGVAGSGKTMVLAKRAVNAHKRTNSKVLVLTYNLVLRNYIHDNISNVRENFHWSHFYIINYHQFFKSQANNHNLSIDGVSSYDNEVFFSYVRNEIEKYDTILIDEIQDYKTEWIKLIKKYFLKEKGEFVVFGDEKQNIYDIELSDDKKPNTTIIGRWNELKESFRLSTATALLATKFQEVYFKDKYEIETIKSFGQQKAFVFDNYEEQIEYYKLSDNISANYETLTNQIIEILHSNNIHPNDVCIMAPLIKPLREIDYVIRTVYHENTITTFESKEVYKKIKDNKDRLNELRRSKKASLWMNGGTMKLSTIHSYKGLETPVEILIITPELDVQKTQELIYTALTRCKYKLFVFDLNNGSYSDLFSGFETENKQAIDQTDRWMNRLWAWADENNIEEIIQYMLKYEDLHLEYGGNVYFFHCIQNNLEVLKSKEEKYLAEIKDFHETQNEYIDTLLGNYDASDFSSIFYLQTGISRNKNILTNSTALDLSDKNISSIPKEIFLLSKLEALGLASNHLRALPQEISNLSQLITLDLRSNQLETLPEEICKLVNLKNLFLYDNSKLILTSSQKDWITHLQNNECYIEID